jgi:hypothetical protein
MDTVSVAGADSERAASSKHRKRAVSSANVAHPRNISSADWGDDPVCAAAADVKNNSEKNKRERMIVAAKRM